MVPRTALALQAALLLLQGALLAADSLPQRWVFAPQRWAFAPQHVASAGWRGSSGASLRGGSTGSLCFARTPCRPFWSDPGVPRTTVHARRSPEPQLPGRWGGCPARRLLLGLHAGGGAPCAVAPGRRPAGVLWAAARGGSGDLHGGGVHGRETAAASTSRGDGRYAGRGSQPRGRRGKGSGERPPRLAGQSDTQTKSAGYASEQQLAGALLPSLPRERACACGCVCVCVCVCARASMYVCACVRAGTHA